MKKGFYVDIAGDVWLGKGKPAPTLLASYFTLSYIKTFNRTRCGLFVWPRCNIGTQSTSNCSHCLIWRLGQTQNAYNKPSRVQAYRPLGHCDLWQKSMHVFFWSSTAPSFRLLTIFRRRLNFTAESFFCELFPLLLPQPTIIHRTMVRETHIRLIFHSLNR